MNILGLFKSIKLLVMDVDGVLTDGSLLLQKDGQHSRTMNIKDGYAIQLAVKKGYQLLVISGANDPAVKVRLNQLGVEEVFLGVPNKSVLLSQKIESLQLNKEQVLYIGDDIPDYEAMQLAGLSCCPSDAASEIKKIAHYISPIPGGKGCVRDIIEKVLKLNNDWQISSEVMAK
jgi:3-deoxy-D-manno-octulosonate 8-phosphate phosphatase (KDO 8-P phosphatase)